MVRKALFNENNMLYIYMEHKRSLKSFQNPEKSKGKIRDKEFECNFIFADRGKKHEYLYNQLLDKLVKYHNNKLNLLLEINFFAVNYNYM